MQVSRVLEVDEEVVASPAQPLLLSEQLPRKPGYDWPRKHAESAIVIALSFALMGLSAALVEISLAQAVAYS
jgi:hypothetical protein